MREKYQKLIYNIKLSSFVDMKMEVGFKNLTINILLLTRGKCGRGNCSKCQIELKVIINDRNFYFWLKLLIGVILVLLLITCKNETNKM